MSGICHANAHALLRARSLIVLSLAVPCLAAAQESAPTELALAYTYGPAERKSH